MPHIVVTVLEGISTEQKKGMAKDITVAVAKHLRIPIDSKEIAIEIVEVKPENIAHGGVLTRDMEFPIGLQE